MKEKTIITVIIGILLLISVVQAFQLTDIKTKIADGKLSVSSSSRSTTAAAGPATDDGAKRTSAVPASIKNLPTMVGGC
jgi:hypothetical protein